jgi:hypothetical protein
MLSQPFRVYRDLGFAFFSGASLQQPGRFVFVVRSSWALLHDLLLPVAVLVFVPVVMRVSAPLLHEPVRAFLRTVSTGAPICQQRPTRKLPALPCAPSACAQKRLVLVQKSLM